MAKILFSEKNQSLLRQLPYFKTFEQPDLAVVADEFQVQTYQPNEIIFFQGDAGAGLHLVATGLCKVYRTSADGREQILYQLEAGDYCNEVSAVDHGPNPASLTALDHTTLWVLRPNAMRRLRDRFPALNDVIITNLAAHARHLSQRVAHLTFLSVKQRLALFLLQSCDANGTLDRRVWSQDEIAAYLGTVRDVAGRALRDLRNAGMLRLDRDKLHITDKAALQELVRS